MNRALIVLCALLLNAVIGGPNRWYRVLGIGKLARIPDKLLRDFERKLNREGRDPEQRETRGQILTIAVLIAALIAGFTGGALLETAGLAQVTIMAFSLPVRPIYDRVAQLRKRLAVNDIPGARQMLDGLFWRNFILLDESGLARAGIETLAIGFSEKIVAPVFWYLCFGLPGLLVTLCVNVMREVLPKANDMTFARPAIWAYDLWHFLPSRIAALFWALTCVFLPARDILAALKGIIQPLPLASPQMLALASAASVLKLSLGGPASAYGNQGWVGSGTAKATAMDVKRALYLFALLNLFLFIILGFFL